MSVSTILDLNQDALIHIMSYLSRMDLTALSLTCFTFYEISGSDYLWIKLMSRHGEVPEIPYSIFNCRTLYFANLRRHINILRSNDPLRFQKLTYGYQENTELGYGIPFVSELKCFSHEPLLHESKRRFENPIITIDTPNDYDLYRAILSRDKYNVVDFIGTREVEFISKHPDLLTLLFERMDRMDMTTKRDVSAGKKILLATSYLPETTTVDEYIGIVERYFSEVKHFDFFIPPLHISNNEKLLDYFISIGRSDVVYSCCLGSRNYNILHQTTGDRRFEEYMKLIPDEKMRKFLHSRCLSGMCMIPIIEETPDELFYEFVDCGFRLVEMRNNIDIVSRQNKLIFERILQTENCDLSSFPGLGSSTLGVDRVTLIKEKEDFYMIERNCSNISRIPRNNATNFIREHEDEITSSVLKSRRCGTFNSQIFIHFRFEYGILSMIRHVWSLLDHNSKKLNFLTNFPKSVELNISSTFGVVYEKVLFFKRFPKVLELYLELLSNLLCENWEFVEYRCLLIHTFRFDMYLNLVGIKPDHFCLGDMKCFQDAFRKNKQLFNEVIWSMNDDEMNNFHLKWSFFRSEYTYVDTYESLVKYCFLYSTEDYLQCVYDKRKSVTISYLTDIIRLDGPQICDLFTTRANAKFVTEVCYLILEKFPLVFLYLPESLQRDVAVLLHMKKLFEEEFRKKSESDLEAFYKASDLLAAKGKIAIQLYRKFSAVTSSAISDNMSSVYRRAEEFRSYAEQ